ncbi:hypothetical protein CHISP_0424 [Chitinispirillum alkaliphilum]|nr:hypothetical protein CHISP_0424 [Chitinispirillum alkaliphilum]
MRIIAFLTSVFLFFSAGLASGGHQNAVLEGIRITSEPTRVPDEKRVSCYFIFRDMPSNYFYDLDTRGRKLVFEFSDSEIGPSSIPTLRELPIRGFETEQIQIDVNADIQGLTPEWHDMVRVTFNLEGLPVITVDEEPGVISFSFLWSNNLDKIPLYSMSERNTSLLVWSGAGLGAVGLGLMSYFIWFNDSEVEKEGPLSTSGRPTRERYDP